MTVDTARTLLREHGQEHILRFWDRLDEPQRAALLGQVAELDFPSVARMRALLAQPAGAAHGAIAPAPVEEPDADARRAAAARGEAALRAGQVGVVLVAGGQGSRLGFEGPKGALPVAPLSGATLFAIHARKILALQRAYGAPVPFYVMTSQANDAATRSFFAEHGYFGLAPHNVQFFAQGMWPALDAAGRILLERPDRLFMSPDGHGGILAALRDRGMLDDMARRGLESLFYFQVDNPIVDIADPAFMGLHLERRAQISVKVCAKRDPNEGLGVVVVRDGRYAVVEYTELTPEQKHARAPDGNLLFRYGSVAIHAFAFDFLRQEADAALPLHVAHKKVAYCGDDGRPVKPAQPNAYKFEKFIFDVLPDAERALNVAFDRAEEFSPVKNAEGADSPAMAVRDMGRKFARWFEACGVAVPRDAAGEPAHRLEVDPCYARTPEELRQRLPAGFRIAGDVLLRGE